MMLIIFTLCIILLLGALLSSSAFRTVQCSTSSLRTANTCMVIFDCLHALIWAHCFEFVALIDPVCTTFTQPTLKEGLFLIICNCKMTDTAFICSIKITSDGCYCSNSGFHLDCQSCH